jgi:hypothetical protein
MEREWGNKGAKNYVCNAKLARKYTLIKTFLGGALASETGHWRSGTPVYAR